MSANDDVAPQFREIYELGVHLKKDILRHLQAWPIVDSRRPTADELDEDFGAAIEALRDRIYRWFNLVTANVLPHTAHHREYVAKLMREVSAAVGGQKYYVEYRPAVNPKALAFMFVNPQAEFNVDMGTSIEGATLEAEEVMSAVLRIVRTAQISSVNTGIANPLRPSPTPNTAFIIMRMNPTLPELDDVHLIVKETFAEFGVAATRADDIQHQDSITQTILERIAGAEFLFADLSGGRPNVYYEVGYAHALGKRPILYRQESTPLHFDLLVHNVPEYRNITDLRQKLRDRLTAITGRSPLNRGAG